MPEKKVQVDTPELRTAATTMNEAGRQLKSVVDTLTNNLNAKGNSFGTDSYGKNFTDGDKGYTTSSKNLLSGGDNMTKSLDQFGGGMDDAATKMDNMDH